MTTKEIWEWLYLVTTSNNFGQSNEQNKLQFMALARDIGLEISAEELQAASGLTDELTDDQLDGVSGGGDRNGVK